MRFTGRISRFGVRIPSADVVDKGVHGALDDLLGKSGIHIKAEGGVLGPGDPPAGKRARVLASTPLIGRDKLLSEYDLIKGQLTGPQRAAADAYYNENVLQYGDAGSSSSEELAEILTQQGVDVDALRDLTFVDEFNRTKKGFESSFPGGVSLHPVHGIDQVQKAIEGFDDEDLIILDHFSDKRILGVPMEGEGNLGQVLKQSVNPDANCYLGICEGETTAGQLRDAGFMNPTLGRPAGESYSGPDVRRTGEDFQNFFFGLDSSGQRADNVMEGVNFIRSRRAGPESITPRGTSIDSNLDFINSF